MADSRFSFCSTLIRDLGVINPGQYLVTQISQLEQLLIPHLRNFADNPRFAEDLANEFLTTNHGINLLCNALENSESMASIFFESECLRTKIIMDPQGRFPLHEKEKLQREHENHQRLADAQVKFVHEQLKQVDLEQLKLSPVHRFKPQQESRGIDPVLEYNKLLQGKDEEKLGDFVYEYRKNHALLTYFHENKDKVFGELNLYPGLVKTFLKSATLTNILDQEKWLVIIQNHMAERRLSLKGLKREYQKYEHMGPLLSALELAQQSKSGYIECKSALYGNRALEDNENQILVKIMLMVNNKIDLYAAIGVEKSCSHSEVLRKCNGILYQEGDDAMREVQTLNENGRAQIKVQNIRSILSDDVFKKVYDQFIKSPPPVFLEAIEEAYLHYKMPNAQSAQQVERRY